MRVLGIDTEAPGVTRQRAPGSDERRLEAGLAAGDRRAAEALVERSYRGIYRALCRLTGGDAELAADLTQETYRKAWTALAGFDGRSRFTTWLFRIAYNTFLNHVRRPHRLEPLEAGAGGEPPDPAPGPEEDLGGRGDAERLRHAVLALPDDLRWTVTARFWGELPVAEIARMEKVTSVAIRKRLKRALALLALELAGGAA